MVGDLSGGGTSNGYNIETMYTAKKPARIAQSQPVPPKDASLEADVFHK